MSKYVLTDDERNVIASRAMREFWNANEVEGSSIRRKHELSILLNRGFREAANVKGNQSAGRTVPFNPHVGRRSSSKYVLTNDEREVLLSKLLRQFWTPTRRQELSIILSRRMKEAAIAKAESI